MTEKEKPGTLMTKTLAMLKQQSLMDVAQGSGLSFYWIRKVANGTIKNPSVNRVQELYEYLSNKKLKI